jgi:hypothetical protein
MTDHRSFTMHPSFGIEYQCTSLIWGEVMKGPSREAVLAYTFKVLHYRALFDAPGATMSSAATGDDPDPVGPILDQAVGSYAAAA